LDPRLGDLARHTFRTRFGGEPKQLAFAPGRVNLIGEHTDYNDGYVLPMGIAKGAAVAFRPRVDRMVHAHSAAFGEAAPFAFDRLVAPATSRDWSAYVAGVAWALTASGREVPGLDLAIASDLPIGAGLSSSAALEVALARAFVAAAELPWDPALVAPLCQKAENDFVGMRCGVMDQFAAAASQEGCALLLDCRSLRTEAVAIPAAAVIVVMDTGVRRGLAGSAYNDRRAACEEALAVLRTRDSKISALRDVSLEQLQASRDRMPAVAFRRAAHVVVENLRPVAMAEALGKNDLPAAGRLMNESHVSLRDLFQVSCPELDTVSQLARTHSACFGARMTGAGFGGCAVALVESGSADTFSREIARAYRARTDREPAFFACLPEAGARLVG
jgi:galactokinase